MLQKVEWSNKTEVFLTVSLRGLRETDSSRVDIVHVINRGAVRLLYNRVFKLQDLRNGLH